MPQHRNKAVVAGLAVTLAFGGVALPAVANTEQAPATDSDPNGVGDPAPADYDKADYYEGTEGVATFASPSCRDPQKPVFRKGGGTATGRHGRVPPPASRGP